MIPGNYLNSFSEYKFYQSFRLPIENADDLRFLVEKNNAKGESVYISDAKLKDISVTGLGFTSKEKISINEELNISLQFKKTHLDLTGRIVRSFSKNIHSEDLIYGVELDEDKRIHKFLELFINSFSPDRMRECLIDSALKERYTKASDGFEMFSLLLSLFKDITNFGEKEKFVASMLDELVRIMNAQRASIFLINPETNELEAFHAMGVDKKLLKFDYRLGIAGSVFTTGIALNIDTQRDKTRFNEKFDKMFNFETRSIICYPFFNREDKIIGVIEVLNKRNQDRFTVDDEKTMKVLALVFSAVFHNYNPMTIKSQIRRFSNPRAREHVMIGQCPHIRSLRNAIIKLKDIESPILIQGEEGVGKILLAKIIHFEGPRGLKSYEIIECGYKDLKYVETQLWGPNEKTCKFTKSQGGTLILRDIEKLPLNFQRKLLKILLDRRLPNSKLSIDTRIICTTTKDLPNIVNEGIFDKELYEYLAKTFINIEPLRYHLEDLPELVDYFFKVECKNQGLLYKSFTTRAMKKLMNYDWPGNVKELRTLVERSVLYNPKSHIISEVDLSSSATPLFDINTKKRTFGASPHIYDYNIPLKDRLALVEQEMIHAEIKRNRGNKSQAAKAMGISREALRKKLIISNEVMEELENKNKVKLKIIQGQKKAA